MRLPTLILLLAALPLAGARGLHGQSPQLSPENPLTSQLSGLRLELYVQIPLRVRVKSMQNGKMEVIIPTFPAKDSMEPPGEKTITLAVGDHWPKPQDYYVLTRITPRSVKEGGITRDASEFALRDTRTGREFAIPKERDVATPDSFAVVVDVNPPAKFHLREEQEWTYPAGSETRYNVKAITPTQVTLEHLASGRKFQIPLKEPTKETKPTPNTFP